MRYLSKITFINSADKSLKYSEIDLDGNVHFIGTQGVGKSTLLRAVLFFYNADTQKLGIPREKKNYNEYYFPYQNSYIIYEVETDAGKFCVFCFKTQGRVAFRFINAGYDKKYFIDSDGKAFETWDKIREALDRVDYTRIISSYEEYRNILYGNNKGLPNEFRKYALIESKQFQNIPRTIANVFLNAKLDAEFVKETIIKSLTEDEIKIDLTTYSQTHLRDFETNLNDIKKWTAGKLGKQAEKVTTTFSALKYLEQKKKDLASQLGFSLNSISEKQPLVQDQKNAEELKRDKIKEKLNDLDKTFGKKKETVLKQIGEVSSKLKDISTKKKEYETIKIESILDRVSLKSKWELEKKNLVDEREILTSKFLEIQQRFDAQLNQLENQLASFKNIKQTGKNEANSHFIQFKDELNKQYESISDEIRKQNQQALESAKTNANEIISSISEFKIKRLEAKYKPFFQQEISQTEVEIAAKIASIAKAETDIEQANEKIKSIQREWEIEEKSIKNDTEREIEKLIEQQGKNQNQIASIERKIESSKNSLFGWLNEHVSNWENTIGKVIDEENVLFQQGLNPKRITDADSSFFGISIDTTEIKKSVKSVSDLQSEQENYKNKIEEIQKATSKLKIHSKEELERLNKRFKPKKNEQKELIQLSEYTISNGKPKLDELNVLLSEWKNKAETEQKRTIEHLENVISKLSEEKTEAENHLGQIENEVSKSIITKKKEKDSKIKAEQIKLAETINMLDKQIQVEEKTISEKIISIKTYQKEELDTKGADTKRIEEVDLKLSEIEFELNFIENNRDKVAEYNKDKRELFDKEIEFKNRKTLLEKELDTESEKFIQQQNKLVQHVAEINIELEAIKATLAVYQNDLIAFESFTKTAIYPTIEHLISTVNNEHKNEQKCTHLISEIHTADNTLTNRYVDLQEAINKFTGNFQENNLFRFKVKFTERLEYFEFAEMLKEFVEEDKASEFKHRVEERFAHIIRQIGRETNALKEKEGEISKIITEINNDFLVRNFVGAIKSMELKTIESKNRIFTLLVEIKNFNDENIFDLGIPDLFSTDGQSNKNEKAISLLIQLMKEMTISKEKEITLSDSFELQFKIVENDNDTGWVEKLTNVGSEGTDVLVKAMINIMLLNVFKEKATKNRNDDFRLHCMMDEIGKLHPNNVKGILKFANDRNILLINSSPTSLNAMDYRYTYLLSKDSKNVTSIKRLVKKITA